MKMTLSCVIRNDIFKFQFWSYKFKRMGRNSSLKPTETQDGAENEWDIETS